MKLLSNHTFRTFACLLLAGLPALLASACQSTGSSLEQEPKEIVAKVDSVAILRIDSLRSSLDSLCQQDFNTQVARLTDSLLQLRIEKMKQILLKNEQK